MPHHHKPAARSSDLSETVLLVATVAIGAAAIETALVPGVLIGGAAWLAPRAFVKLRRVARRGDGAALAGAQGSARPRGQLPQKAGSWQNSFLTTSVAKTVTFRVISSGLDFGWNYLVLGEIGAAAGLSGFSLIAAPTFYFLHETLWSRVWSTNAAAANQRAIFQIPADIGGVKISRAMAKTVTFRLFATVSEFGVNYAVARDLLTATKLSAFSIVAGPFVYLAHERVWEHYEASRQKRSVRRDQPLLAGPSDQMVS